MLPVHRLALAAIGLFGLSFALHDPEAKVKNQAKNIAGKIKEVIGNVEKPAKKEFQEKQIPVVPVVKTPVTAKQEK